MLFLTLAGTAIQSACRSPLSSDIGAIEESALAIIIVAIVVGASIGQSAAGVIALVIVRAWFSIIRKVCDSIHGNGRSNGSIAFTLV